MRAGLRNMKRANTPLLGRVGNVKCNDVEAPSRPPVEQAVIGEVIRSGARPSIQRRCRCGNERAMAHTHGNGSSD